MRRRGSKGDGSEAAPAEEKKASGSLPPTALPPSTKPSDPPAVWVHVDELVPWVKNPRKNAEAIARAKVSITEFGWGAPLLARSANKEIIAGHSRIVAAKELGIEWVPVRYMSLDEERAHALAIADNRVGEFSSWDDDLLSEVLRELSQPVRVAAGYDDDNPIVTGIEPRPAGLDDKGLVYTQQFGVLVVCATEKEQRDAYGKLEKMGYTLRVLTV